ncbi:hypothetical protein J3459_006411 [Metarhizium acridum]|uniref:2EXR domain-containing protein n=1 Tax=Metarhizium acridum (strain CQMa 102) TaxID=655827 RepID=E9E112_METAQ|nr:uncharacterized protein MAC_03560 [Metarhizium acridum CQMa 102]EFY90314.1 hypothetical protein MAC_03560 [Metarhizium acridum CQMa 102]KAG8417732.1 hypothetical protein J3458_005213 [Metarhizium acridum]KAG8427758.1 hypothetical protein J3459_006411 [Metarhizium acridum]
MAATTFHRFARLPAELRRQIYVEYLSPLDAPAVYLYNKNLVLRYLDPEGEDERYAGISHEPRVQVKTPALVHVNAEARAVTMSWARMHGISLGFRKETRGHVFSRPWDPARDALYVSREKWEEFCELPWDSQGVEEMAAKVRHLALPAFTAYYSFNELGNYLMQWFTSLEVLSSVWGGLPDLKYSRTKRVPRRRLLAAGATDDDGTDTGVDPVTGEREERIAAEIQPVWELVRETEDVVRMCVRDPLDETESWEEGELQMWMEELAEAFLTTELPEHVYDVEEERFLVEFRPVRAVRG